MATEPSNTPLPSPTGAKPVSKALQIGVLIIVLGITVLLFIYRDQLQGLQNYGYLGIFLLSIAANATVILPVPGVAFTTAMGAIFDPVGVALAAGVGAAIGELTGYAAGASGGGLISKNQTYHRLVEWMGAHPRWAFWVVVLLAFIPNPLMDLAGMASGALKIPVRKYLLACTIGKIGKMLLFAYAGRFSFNLIGK